MKKVIKIFALFSVVSLNFNLYAQIQHEVEGDAVIEGKLGIKEANVDPSAIIEIQSSTEGILIPRMTSAQRGNISNPAKGLLVFDNTTSTFWFHNGSSWMELNDTGGNNGSSLWYASGSSIINSNSGRVGINTIDPGAELHVSTSSLTTGNGDIGLRVGGIGDVAVDASGIIGGRLVVKESGQVGIGIANPEIKLQVASGTDVNGTSGGFIQTGVSTATNMGIDNNEIQARVNGIPGPLYLQDSGGHLIMKGGGNFGIGQPFPSASLDLFGDAKFRGTDYVTHINFSVDENSYFRGGKANSKVFISDQNTGGTIINANGGNVGIGIDTPLQKLHIGNNGNLRLDGNEGTYTTFNTYAGSGTSNAIFQIDPSPGTVTSASTIRLFRSVNTSADVGLMIFKGNGTTQHNHLFQGKGDSFMSLDGNLGVGTVNTKGYKFAVKGNIGAEEIEVRTNYWADFVFDNDYLLRPLEQVEEFINNNGHLPDIPSEEEAISTPLNLGEMDVLLLQKIEELTLYTLEQEKKIASQNEMIIEIAIELKKLKNQ